MSFPLLILCKRDTEAVITECVICDVICNKGQFKCLCIASDDTRCDIKQSFNSECILHLYDETEYVPNAECV